MSLSQLQNCQAPTATGNDPLAIANVQYVADAIAAIPPPAPSGSPAVVTNLLDDELTLTTANFDANSRGILVINTASTIVSCPNTSQQPIPIGATLDIVCLIDGGSCTVQAAAGTQVITTTTRHFSVYGKMGRLVKINATSWVITGTDAS